MLNREIAWHLQTISVLLELSDENPFKVRAYSNAARELKRLSRPVPAMLEDGSIEHVEGIGPGILKVIQELVATGQSSLLQELRRQVPPALVELGSIPGIGAKTARKLVQQLGVQNVAELEAAAEAGKVRQIPGFGEKKEQLVLSGIELLRSRGTLTPIGISRPIAEALARIIRQCEWVHDARIAGSVRRWQELNADIDLVAATEDEERLIRLLDQIKGITVTQAYPDRIMLRTSMDLAVRIWLVDSAEFAVKWLHYTGSREHVEALSKRGELRGSSEEEIYANLGLQFVPPELRQPDLDLNAFAMDAKIPPLVELDDIKGDLHLHTHWSDGVLDIDSLARLAADRGYQYIAVTDHSPSLAIARGLPAEKLERQLGEIRSRQHQFPLAVLAGIEVDIRPDGSLDMPDRYLARLDWVMASVHSSFNLDRESMTRRIVKAMANPYVNAIGHPSGRLLQRRPGYDLDWDKLFAAARDHEVAVEINSSPDRLDIRDKLVRQAVGSGVKITINTDAHSGNELSNMKFGVATARRGGASSEDVVNCLSLEQLQRHLKGKQG